MSAGIFGLSAYNDKNLEGLIPDKTRESFREYGYFGSGYASGNVSIVDRVDYSNDTQTASVRGPLGIAKRGGEATGNSNFGYFGSGIIPAIISTVDRIDYSNDTAQASPRGPLSQAKYSSSASGNSNFGWFTGGHTNANTTDINFSISTIDRIDYSNDLSTASIRGKLNQNRTNHSIAGNSNYGWIAGGNRATNDNSYFTSVERLDYSNDVSLTSFRSTSDDISGQGTSATGNNNFGYYHRGVNPSGVSRTEVNRIDYSNDLVSPTLRSKLTLLITTRAATGNSNFGYFSGGSLLPGFTPNSSVERIDYSNDTATASVRGPLSLAKSSFSATSSHNFGGSPISQYGVFPKPFGYFGGGRNGPFSTVDRIDYSNDTSTVSVRGPLSLARYGLAATGNSNFGYFGGGNGPVSTVDRIDYSNDSSAASVRGPLSFSTFRHSAFGNNNFGWFAGGGAGNGGQLSVVSRVDYTNDTSTARTRGTLSQAKTAGNCGSGIGNFNFGYYCGGLIIPGPNTQVTTVDRIDYSNDNATASARGPLDAARTYMSAAGTNNFGYVFGGRLPGPIKLTSIARIDYATDTSTASVRGNLATANMFRTAATGNSNFGYIGGYGDPGSFSTVNRYDYSNDTTTATIRGPLSSARYESSATSPLTPSSAFSPDQLIRGTSNTDFQPTSTFFDIQSMRRIEDTTNESVKKRVLGSYGYFGGGSLPIPSGNNRLDRIDYSNDTQQAIVRSPLTISRSGLAAIGNSNFGYFGGGRIPTAIYSRLDRIDYSNDSSSLRGLDLLSFASRNISASGNSNFGYFCGGSGFGPTPASSVRRIDYSNDTAASTRGPLSLAKQVLAATGNSNFGYFGGGDPGPLSTIDRIDYSNDTQTASVRGPLSLARYGLAATGNSNFGYFGGGFPAPRSTIDRIDYSNDTQTASVRGPLSLARYGLAATGNSNFGYFGGGNGPVSTVDRIDYSNDTQTASVRGPLSLARYGLAATTNARNS